MLEEESVEALGSLGLSLVQTKVFLALGKSASDTVHGIASLSKVPRQDIYRVISELEELSLVQKVVTKPVRFRAVSLEEAVCILLRKKKEEFRGIERKSQSFLRRIEGAAQEGKLDKSEFQFFVVKGRDALLKNIKEHFIGCLETVDIATTQERFLQALSHLGSLYKKKLQEGVTCRIVTENPTDKGAFLSGIGSILNYPNLQLKNVSYPLKANVVIFDKKVALAAMQAGEPWLKSPVILTNNPAFLAMFQEFFNKTWVLGKFYDEELRAVSRESTRNKSRNNADNPLSVYY